MFESSNGKQQQLKTVNADHTRYEVVDEVSILAGSTSPRSPGDRVKCQRWWGARLNAVGWKDKVGLCDGAKPKADGPSVQCPIVEGARQR